MIVICRQKKNNAAGKNATNYCFEKKKFTSDAANC